MKGHPKMRWFQPYTFLSLLLFVGNCAADTFISFEPPLPSGLAPMGFYEDTPVTSQAKITNQYANRGVQIANGALVNLAAQHATSGTNGIARIRRRGTSDYGSHITFTSVDDR